MKHYILTGLFTGLLILSGCNLINPKEELPSYVSIQNAAVCLDPACQDQRTNGMKAVWVYREGLPVPLGIFGSYSKFPLPDTQKKKLSFRAGVFENGSSNFIKDYPFLRTIEITPTGIPGGTDTITPIFTYYQDSIISYPIDEGFEGLTLQLEPFGTQADMAQLTRTSEGPYIGTSAGVIAFDATRKSLQLQSVNEFDLPGSGSQVWMELAYKGDFNLQAGLISLLNGVRVLNQNTILKTGEWTVLYLNFTPLATPYSSGKFRLWLKAEGEGQTGNVYLDRVRILHFKP